MRQAGVRFYLKAPVWLQNILVTAYGLHLRHLRYGRVQRDTLQSLRRSQWCSSQELRVMQLAELNRVVRHARDTVPLYRQRGLPKGPIHRPESIRDLPLLTKEDLRQPLEVVTSEVFRSSRLEEIHTGGTTGKPLTIHCDSATLQRNYAFFARFREWAGVSPGGRVATFMGRVIVPPEQRRPPFWRRNAAGNTLLFSSYHLAPDTLRAYVNRLVEYKPVLIDAYPSSIEPIARYVKDHGIRGLRPQAVITSSETLLEPVRRLIADAFCCPVFDHYGAAEMAALVTQCEAGSYHLNPEFGIVEILRDGEPVGPGEPGEIVATGFINPVMPLIRYGTGDVAMWGPCNCRCGRAFPTLERIEGRMDDVLVTPEGRRIGRLDPIFKSVSSLYETRIVQDQPDHVRVEVVLNAPMSSAEETALRYELGNRLGPQMRIDILRVTSLPRTAAGKLRAVVNEFTSAQRTN